MLHEVHEDTHEKCNVAWKSARGMPCCQSLIQISMAIVFGGTMLSKTHVEMNETAFDCGCTVFRMLHFSDINSGGYRVVRS